MKTVNDFKGATDSDRIEAAIAARENGIVIIPPRKSDIEPERDYWLIDRAILVPENTTIILQNCKIKLSDRCRDNFFRSANCGLGIENIEVIRNIHIRGEGLCILEGADHPRSTGDGSKILSCPCPKKPQDLIRLADWIPEERKKTGKLDFWSVLRFLISTPLRHPSVWMGLITVIIYFLEGGYCFYATGKKSHRNYSGSVEYLNGGFRLRAKSR